MTASSCWTCTTASCLPTRNGADGTEDAQRAYEEDRRLFYVAMTRAKNELYLFDYPDVPSAFVRELRQQLPRLFRPAEDFASILPENACGLRYRHAVHGEGQILAQCGDAMLVAFADGDRCLQAGQMLLERDRTPDAQDCSAVRAAPAAGGGRLRARQRDLAPEIRPRPHRVPAGHARRHPLRSPRRDRPPHLLPPRRPPKRLPFLQSRRPRLMRYRR